MELLQSLKQKLEQNPNLSKQEKLELAVQEVMTLLPPMARSTCQVFMNSYLQFDQLDDSVIDEGMQELKELLELFEG